MKNLILFAIGAALCSLVLSFSSTDIDLELSAIIKKHNLKPTAIPPAPDSVKVELGRKLFFDKLLSGNKDISCATCHHPSLASSDGLPLSIGVGGNGLGAARQMGPGRERIPRNSPDIFNRGAKEWHTMFWDNRVSGSPETGFESPAEEKLPEGLENLLAVQAMFPVTSRDEMRGNIGDRDVNGQINELALISDASPQVIWHRIMLRLLEIPEYRRLFREVYPDVPVEKLGFQHAANAIAAFEIAEFTFSDSPWDLYLAGKEEALPEAAKRGALLFYGKANCVSCHSGSLMTDQLAHNIGAPQLGPGKGYSAPMDAGRYLETGDPADLFSFRTPSLKNTAITGPWMHSGAYSSLEDAVRHHLDPEGYLQKYNCSQLPPELQGGCRDKQEVNQRILAGLDPILKTKAPLNDREIQELLSFLEALTDSSARQLDRLIPASVPSGLPVSDD